MQSNQDSYRGLQISPAALELESRLHGRQTANLQTRFASQRCHTEDPLCDGLEVDVVPPSRVAETLQCLVYISHTRMGNVGTNYRLGRMGCEAHDDVDRRGGAAMGEREVPAVNSKQIMCMDGASAYCLTWLTTMAHVPQGL